jgi:Creatinine amidohydrolase
MLCLTTTDSTFCNGCAYCVLLCVLLLLSLRSTYAAVISDIVTSFKRTGFSHILLLNGHGGNIAPGQWGLANGQAMVEVSSSVLLC